MSADLTALILEMAAALNSGHMRHLEREVREHHAYNLRDVCAGRIPASLPKLLKPRSASLFTCAPFKPALLGWALVP